MKNENIKVDFNQKRICNNLILSGGFMQLDENAIKIATEKDGEHKLNPQTFIVWQALCITYFKEEQRAITKNLGLSTKHIADSYGFNKRVVQRAIEELVEKGWLINVRDELWMLIVPGTVAAEKKAEQVDDKERVYWKYTGVCTASTQGCVSEVHRGMYQKYTGVCTGSTQGCVSEVHTKYNKSIIKEEQQVEEEVYTDDVADAPSDDTDFFFDAPAEHKNEYTPLDVHVSEEDNFFD